MNTKFFTSLLATITLLPLVSLAAPQIQLFGEARLHEELMILKERVVCTGAIAPIVPGKRVDPKDLKNVEWTMGFAPSDRTGFMASGNLDGDLVSIQGDLSDGRMNLSVQEPRQETNALPRFSASTSGALTAQYGVSLDYSRNGKQGSIHCGFKK